MSEPRFEIISTESGAPALRDLLSGEVMHPGRGPLEEAQAIYVAPARLPQRLVEPNPEPLVLLDLGLGAGSNALCALRAAQQLPAGARRLEIISLDLDSAALRHALESEQRAAFGMTDELEQAARSLLARQRYESARASWRLVLGDALAELARLSVDSLDVVFWDPYSPRTNPELWSERAFAAARGLCRAGATLHTYGAATATRSALLLAGFFVGFGPALGSKRAGPRASSAQKQRHATMAATRLEDLARPLDRAWLANFPRFEASGAAREKNRARHEPALSCEAVARLSRSPQFA
jgi:queuine tRNA-ribosyltransferase